MSRPRGIAAALGAALALLPSAALAHGGVEGAGVSTSLAVELPGILGLLAAIGVPYLAGVRRLWANAGRGRGIRTREAASFGAGLLVLGVALLGPVFVPVTAEFSGHMAQHLLLLVVAAPLLAFGQPSIAYAWMLRGAGATGVLRSGHRLRRTALARHVTHPAVLLGAYIAVVWVWHVPALYNLAARNELLHGLEHMSMLGVSFAFWWRIRTLELSTGRRQVMAFFLLFAAMFPELVLGAFIAFAREPLYEAHRLGTEARGSDPVVDQQLGGFVMLMLGGLAYAGVALAGMLRFLAADERSRVERSKAEHAPVEQGLES